MRSRVMISGPTWARRLGVVLVTVAVSLTACRGAAAASPTSAATAASPTGRSDATLSVDGRERTYHVYRPESSAGRTGLALVVMLHGGFGSGAQAEKSYGWDAEADRAGFVVAYPDGLNRAWNAGGGCCGVPGRSGTDDVGFIVAMVRRLQAQYPIDPKRLYVTGISNGGMMAYRLACDTSLFAAIAPDSATLLGDCPSAGAGTPHPVSVLHLHGTADTNIRYDGGPGTGVARIDGPPVPAVIARWRTIDGCATPRVSTAGAVTTSLASCPDGRTVELITIAGAGHQWPGATPLTPAERVVGLDPPSSALDATATIWQFFATHRAQP